PDVPVTIAWGTRDRIMRRPQAAMVTRLIPHARLLSLPGCGHIPMTDDPALVAHVLLTGSDERSVREGLTAARDGDPPPLPEMQSA
ncbi:MAG: alpha/beta fold hydrolase, partial [Pseudonocardiaceae bacterium]